MKQNISFSDLCLIINVVRECWLQTLKLSFTLISTSNLSPVISFLLKEQISWLPNTITLVFIKSDEPLIFMSETGFVWPEDLFYSINTNNL